MSNLSNQQIKQSFQGLLQIPGGVTAQQQQVQDGNGNGTGLFLSSSGVNVTTADSFVASVDGVSVPNATARLISDGFGDYISVKDFGATGDGVTNDTAAIQTADTQARALGTALWFPGGTYMVSQLVLHTGSNWIGAGRDATIIKQIAGSNTDLIYGYNSNANWGDTTPVDFANGFTLRSLTLDGNKALNSSGSGIAAFASRPIIQDVFIKNCADYGMRTEYADAAAGLDTFAMEGFFSNIKIDTVGKHGWYNSGPHDSTAIGVIVIDAGQASADTYDGFYLNTSTTHIGCHAWTRASSVRARSALNVLGSGSNFSGGCQFEGGYTANVILANQKNIFDPSTRYYAAWNGVNILLTGTQCTENYIYGSLGQPGSGRPACIGFQFGNSITDYISANHIEVICSNQNSGNLSFYAGYTGGKNIISVTAYNSTGTVNIVGTPLSSEHISYYSASSATSSSLPVLNVGYTAFGSVVPASVALTQSKVYAVENSNAQIAAICAGGSPTFIGLNVGGGDVTNPTFTADYGSVAKLLGRGYTQSGSIVDVGTIVVRARSPSGANLSGDMTFSVRNASSLTEICAINTTGITPSTTNTFDLGDSAYVWSNVFSTQFRPGTGSAIWTSGANTPEGAVTAPVGSLYTRTNGGAGTTLYVKESGTGNTGWVAK